MDGDAMRSRLFADDRGLLRIGFSRFVTSVASLPQGSDVVDVNAKLKHGYGGSFLGIGGRLVRKFNGGGGSYRSGKPADSIHLVSITNSKPVKPMPDLRRNDNSFGEFSATSVIELPSSGSI